MANLKSIELRNKAAEVLKKAKAITEGKERMTEEEAKSVRTYMDEHDLLMAQAADHERIEKADAKMNAPATRLPAFEGPGDEGEEEEPPPSGRKSSRHEEKIWLVAEQRWAPIPKSHFACLGDQLMSIKNHYVNGGERSKDDERLYQVKALGGNEEVLSEAGFLLEPQYANYLFSKAYAISDFASRCRRFTVGPNSNGVAIRTVDETSRATGSRWGGMQAYWVMPGVAAAAVKPSFGEVNLRMKKLMIVHYATDEELADISIMNSLIGQAAAEEMAWMLNEGIFCGTGNGMPLGYMNAPCLVTVAKETGQAAVTVVQQNISKMWSRFWAPGRPYGIWIINQDVEPQLDQLALTVGLGGVPVYMPPGGLTDLPYGRLKGRPVLISENALTCGTPGDITLFDPQEYALADKGGVNSELSIHVAFLTDESCFRFTYRVDGQPLWRAPLTPAKGANTLSMAISLAVRA